MGGVNTNGRSHKVVAIGGGTGISSVLAGLKRHDVDLTAIVTAFDSGGSSGLLRAEFGYPPLGDLRQCLLALGDETRETQSLRNVFGYRFGRNTSLNGHTIGNLLLAALTSLNDDIEKAIAEVSQLLRVRGQVIPVTLERADLCAELEDGQVIQGESDIDLRAVSTPRIRRVFLTPEVHANPRAIEAILEADAIVMGPGDLYTSVLPNLLATGVREAIASSQANRIYMCNLMTKHGETDGFKASDFVREVTRYLKPAQINWAVVNSAMPPEAIQRAYEAENAYVVSSDLEEVRRLVGAILAAPLASAELPLRHDPERTAIAVLKAIGAGPMGPRSGESVPATTPKQTRL